VLICIFCRCCFQAVSDTFEGDNIHTAENVHGSPPSNGKMTTSDIFHCGTAFLCHMLICFCVKHTVVVNTVITIQLHI